MKIKLAIVTAVALVGAVFALSQPKAEAALPGQVGDAPRCNVSTGKARTNSFVVNGATANVKFTAEGGANCRVRVSTNSFYAPSMDGKPWSAQILFDRKTKVVGPGTHSLNVDVPVTSTKKKGCFYQLDLTYGTHNVLPVLAYEHGAIKDCGQPKPQPEAACTGLTARQLPGSRTQFQLNATASVKNGAKVTGYVFTVTGNGRTVTKPVTTSLLSTGYVHQESQPGVYSVAVTALTSVGEKNGAACQASFTVTPEVPGKITVCEIATKQTVTINENEMSDKYTKDFSKCAPTPQPPAPEQPKALPDTGVGTVFALFTGMTSLSSTAYYVIKRRLLF